MSREIVQQAFLSKETYDIAMWQVACGFCDGIYSKEVQEIIKEEVLKMVAADEISDAAKSHLKSLVAIDLPFFGQYYQ